MDDPPDQPGSADPAERGQRVRLALEPEQQVGDPNRNQRSERERETGAGTSRVSANRISAKNKCRERFERPLVWMAQRNETGDTGQHRGIRGERPRRPPK